MNSPNFLFAFSPGFEMDIFCAVPFQLWRPFPENKDFFRTHMVSKMAGSCHCFLFRDDARQMWNKWRCWCLPSEMCLLCVIICSLSISTYMLTYLHFYHHTGSISVCRLVLCLFWFVYDLVVPMSLRSLPDCTLVATTKVLQRTLAEHCPLPGRDPTSGGEFPWKRSLQST